MTALNAHLSAYQSPRTQECCPCAGRARRVLLSGRFRAHRRHVQLDARLEGRSGWRPLPAQAWASRGGKWPRRKPSGTCVIEGQALARQGYRRVGDTRMFSPLPILAVRRRAADRLQGRRHHARPVDRATRTHRTRWLHAMSPRLVERCMRGSLRYGRPRGDLVSFWRPTQGVPLEVLYGLLIIWLFRRRPVCTVNTLFCGNSGILCIQN